MARPKGSKNKAKTAPEGEGAPPPPSNGVGHNANGGLSDEQRQALFFQHKKSYESGLATKKKADADFKNVCKRAKSELGKHAVDEIKLAIGLEEDDGDTALQARIERELRVARYMGSSVGTQFEMFGDGVDRQPAVDRARDEGKRAGMQGQSKKAPYDHTLPQHDAWCEGWDTGQKAIFDIQKKQDGEVFDLPPVGDQLSSFEETAAE
jgi:ribosome modulation factor